MDSLDFLISTDHPIDKVIGYHTGSVTVSAFNFNDFTLTHGFGFAPLYSLRWSYSPAFDESFEETTRFEWRFRVSCATKNNVTEVRTSNNTSTSRTIYYRIIYFAPFDLEAPYSYTQLQLDDFNINTDYNYPKILLEGYLPSSGGSVAHNLGYIPQVEAWSIDDFGLSRWMGGAVFASGYENKILVSTSSVTYQKEPASFWSPSIYYRIYGDPL